jgi:hypothetical protein
MQPRRFFPLQVTQNATQSLRVFIFDGVSRKNPSSTSLPQKKGPDRNNGQALFRQRLKLY